MSTSSRARKSTEPPRSGGKILRENRITSSKTPYDRPSLPPPEKSPNNNNWFSTATRVITSGAGKIISSVFGPESSSSSDSGSSSDDEVDNDDCQNDISSERAERLRKGKDHQTIGWGSETKCIIEQLLTKETFTREECDRMVKIVKSRVVDTPTTEGPQDGNEIPRRTVGSDTPMIDLCSTAVMEARKWLEDKKLGSGSKSDLDYGTCSLNCIMSPHVTEGEVGSPVDMAKSFMRSRPPWASPTTNPFEFKSPSPSQMQSFIEESPYSIAGKSVSSSKLKKDSVASESWSISDAIRKVRAKATEDLLGTPSTKIDWSAFASDYKTKPISGETDRIKLGVEDKLVDSNLTALESVEKTLNLANEVGQRQEYPDLEMTQDEMRTGGLSSTPALLTSEQNQELTGAKSHEAKEASGPNDRNYATSRETNGLEGTSIANGFPLEPSLSVRLDTDSEPGRSDRENPTPVTCSTNEKTSINGHEEEACQLLSEASMEIPNVSEPDDGVSPRQKRIHNEELNNNAILALATQNDDGLAGKVSNLAEKQRGKKQAGRGTRRGRGRGK